MAKGKEKEKEMPEDFSFLLDVKTTIGFFSSTGWERMREFISPLHSGVCTVPLA